MTAAFEKRFDIKIDRDSKLPSYYKLVDGKIIHYGFELDDVFYGSDFYMHRNKITELESHECFVGAMIFNLQTKEFRYPAKNLSGQEPEIIKDLRRVFSVYPVSRTGTPEKGFEFFINGHKILGTSPMKEVIDFLSAPWKTGTLEASYAETLSVRTLRIDNISHIEELVPYYKWHSFISAGVQSIESTNNNLGQIHHIEMPNLKYAGDDFLKNYDNLETARLDNLEAVGTLPFQGVNKKAKIFAPKLSRRDILRAYSARRLEWDSKTTPLWKYILGTLFLNIAEFPYNIEDAGKRYAGAFKATRMMRRGMELKIGNRHENK